jgi:signal transduction histidine kinase
MVVCTTTLAFTSSWLEDPGLRAFLTNWIVVPYVVSGAVAWRRRPANRIGPLMMATGFTVGLTALEWSDTEWMVSIGQLVDILPAAMFLHVFLAWPSGRLPGRPEQILVGVAYAIAVGLQAVKLVVGVYPGSSFDVWHEQSLGRQLERFQLISLSVVLLIGVVLLVARSPERLASSRRPLILLADAFRLSLVMLALLLIAGVQSWTSYETLRHVTFAALGLAPIAFLFGLLDARLARGDVAALLVDLRAGMVSDLEAAVAKALRDPSLRVAYWVPRLESWADSEGNPAEVPADSETVATRIIRRDREPVAALVFDKSLDDEYELIDAVAAAAALSLEHGRLQAELRARLQELQGSRERLLDASQKERQRLERNLHDGAQQRLVALSVELGLLKASARADPELAGAIAHAQGEVAASLDELRDIARGIYPAVLTGRGLPVALRSLAARSAVPVELVVDLDGRFGEHVEAAVYYVVSESLANIGKHAHAESASVHVASVADDVVVTIVDDGVGGADPDGGSGLRGLADRVETLGGRLRVWTPVDGGTHVRAEIPCG